MATGGKLDASDFGVSADQERDAVLFLLKTSGHEAIHESNTAETQSNADAPAPTNEVEPEGTERSNLTPLVSPLSFSSSLQDSSAAALSASSEPLDFGPTCSGASAAALLSSPVALSLLATPCPDAAADPLGSVPVPARGAHVQASFARQHPAPRRQAQVVQGGGASLSTHPLDDAVSRIEARVLQQQGDQTDVDDAQGQPGAVVDQDLASKADEKPALASSASVESATTAANSSADSSPACSPAPRVTWTPGFRLPLGAEGRQVLLRRLRRAYHASPPETRDTFLASHGLVFSRMPFATVSELFHLAHLLGVFDFAVQCSEEFGGVSNATGAVAGRGGRSGALAGNASAGAAGTAAGNAGDGAVVLRVGSGAKRRRTALKRHAGQSPQTAPRNLRAQVAQRRLHGAGSREVFGGMSPQDAEGGAAAEFMSDGTLGFLHFEEPTADAEQLNDGGDVCRSALSSPVSAARRTPRGLKKRRRRPLASHTPSRHQWGPHMEGDQSGCALFGWTGGVNEAADCVHDGALSSDLCTPLNVSRPGFPFGADRREPAKGCTGTQKQLLQVLQQLGLFSREMASAEVGDSENLSAAVHALQMQLQALAGNPPNRVEKAASPSSVPRRTGTKRAVCPARRTGASNRRRCRDIVDRLTKADELRVGEAEAAYSLSGSLFGLHEPSQSETVDTSAKTAGSIDFSPSGARDSLSDQGHTRQESLPLSVSSSLSSLTEETAPSLEALLARSLAASIGNGQDCAPFFGGAQACVPAPDPVPAASGRDFFQFVDQFKTRMDATEDAVAAKQADASLEELTREREILLRSILQGELSQEAPQRGEPENGELATPDSQEALLLSLLQKTNRAAVKRPVADFSATDAARLEDVNGSEGEAFENSQGLLDVSLEALRGLSSQAGGLQAARQRTAPAFQGADLSLGSSELVQLLQTLPAGADLASAGQVSLPGKSTAAVPSPASTNAQYALGLQFLRLVEMCQLHNNLSGLLGALPKVQGESGLATGVEEELKRAALGERDDSSREAYEPTAVRATPVTTGEDSSTRHGTGWGSGSDSLRSRSGSFSDRTTQSGTRTSPAGIGCILGAADGLADGVRSSFSTCCSEGLPASASAPRGEAMSYPSDEECLRLKLARQGPRVC
ncbi:conserved hypothetical protein [Neospora caninum Liverpool]|uniref:Uncharacterized protein n=1 Tax=Neospora caninum (strain Liverpool) TaxID=572307 RepID=F0VFT2_NEOCL|nr:conserved hypothetical protein [Neospora caninum Liverpool]CBZ52576.1 conserved hypothetical protein [Neospora caninum Liverpool]CEL66553.1 TPA: hypothetical protein BN1204_023640 [Neospora caninum Liverpool]|eukprot:XP_003882608.1 conserved hypothetical protein [Neospora caninum Liverpool]